MKSILYVSCEQTCINFEGYFAIISAVLAVIFTEIAVWIRNVNKHRKNRKIRLGLLQTELEKNKEDLQQLKGDLGQDKVHKSIDASAFHSFLSSDVINLEDDKTLLTTIYKHLGNINQLDHALRIIEFRAAGFTNVQATANKILETNLKNAIDEYIKDVDACLKEIKKCLKI